MNKIAPSMLACDFSCLEQEAKRMEQAGADMLHLDVMDGHFVPNLSFGQPVIRSLRRKTDLLFDVHLMISSPLRYIESFVAAGADSICFHLECDDDPTQVIEAIRSFGKKVAISIKPGTPVEALRPYLELVDMVLIMTVEPGFGGQSFMHDMMDKVMRVRVWSNEVHPGLDIQVDGGINAQTAQIAIEAGANVLVAGTYLFRSDNPSADIAMLKSL